MNKREAKRDCYRVVGDLIQGYFDVGQPGEDQGCDDATTCVDCLRKTEAMEEIQGRMFYLGGNL